MAWGLGETCRFDLRRMKDPSCAGRKHFSPGQWEVRVRKGLVKQESWKALSMSRLLLGLDHDPHEVGNAEKEKGPNQHSALQSQGTGQPWAGVRLSPSVEFCRDTSSRKVPEGLSSECPVNVPVRSVH